MDSSSSALDSSSSSNSDEEQALLVVQLAMQNTMEFIHSNDGRRLIKSQSTPWKVFVTS